MSKPSRSASGQRNKIIFADSLQHQERRRAVAAVDYEVRACGPHRECLAGSEADFLLGIAEEDADPSMEDVERFLDIVVVVPGRLLLRGDLNRVDPEAGAFGVRGPPLDLVELARVLHRFHDDPLESKSRGAQYIAAEAKGSSRRLRYGFRGMTSASPVSRRDLRLLRISGQPSFTASKVTREGLSSTNFGSKLCTSFFRGFTSITTPSTPAPGRPCSSARCM